MTNSELNKHVRSIAKQLSEILPKYIKVFSDKDGLRWEFLSLPYVGSPATVHLIKVYDATFTVRDGMTAILNSASTAIYKAGFANAKSEVKDKLAELLEL